MRADVTCCERGVEIGWFSKSAVIVAGHLLEVTGRVHSASIFVDVAFLQYNGLAADRAQMATLRRTLTGQFSYDPERDLLEISPRLRHCILHIGIL
jgi:hypothetical protein